ncbi:DUF4260 family protein [Tabrizicola sp. BL-A-41-H6]|uniref:DUF4260 family protein n=1 Tax=Tabrizicola sp. BL-A-41-H6 TaxID=3421107 RepID=UPI003D6701F8
MSATHSSSETTSLSDGLKTVLRLEGLGTLTVGLGGALSMSDSWLAVAGMFFLPDLSMAGYALGPRVGALIYNIGHSYILPLALLALAAIAFPALIVPALVWIAHIGFDRAMGYGMKGTAGFKQTHLGRIGR